MFVLKVFPDYGMFMLITTLMEVMACVTNIICIPQIMFKFTEYVLLVN